MKLEEIKVGMFVQASASYLRITGQYSGPETQKVWSVVGVGRSFVYLSEDNLHALEGVFTAEEIANEPLLMFRAISPAALSKTNKRQSMWASTEVPGSKYS